jgi:hypothetical protein
MQHTNNRKKNSSKNLKEKSLALEIQVTCIKKGN